PRLSEAESAGAERRMAPDRRRSSRRYWQCWLSTLSFGYSLLIAGSALGAAEEVVEAKESPSPDDHVVKLSGLPECPEGKYGTGHTTQILEVPFRADWSVIDRLDLSLTIPYVWIRGRGDVTIVAGRAVTQRHGVSRQTGQVGTEDGLGDILAELDYTLLE